MERVLDIAVADYDEWLRLVFDHPIEEDEIASWIWEEELAFDVSDSSVLFAHFTRLCRNFAQYTELYTLPQINAGVWFLFSEPTRLGEHLADESVALELRLDAIRAMYHPYADFVAVSEVEVMENCFDMWWDLVTTGYRGAVDWKYNGDKIMAETEISEESLSDEDRARRENFMDVLRNANPEADIEEVLNSYGLTWDDYPTIQTTQTEVVWEELTAGEQRVLDVMLETLVKVLALNEDRCDQYALHGLGHLIHPQKAAVVQKFIDDNRDAFDENGIAWLEQCRDGTVM